MRKKTKNCLVKILSYLALFSVCTIAKVRALHVDIPEGTMFVRMSHVDCLCKNKRHDIDSVTIPNSAISVWSCAFKGCSKLTNITIPNSVARIDLRAFKDCSSLKTIIIPNSVARIGLEAFKNCSSLKTIIIPNSVNSIGKNAFQNCNNLTEIHYNGSTYPNVEAFYQAFNSRNTNN